MFARQTFVRLILGLAVCLAAAVPALAQESAWEEYIRRNPEAVDDDTLGPLERRILHALTPDQVQALFDGAVAEEIVLDSGQTLAEYLRDSVGGGPGLVYVPVDLCRLFATSAQTVPVSGRMAADEIRAYVARGAGTAHTDQGGMPAGCGIPDEALAALIHFRVVPDRIQDAFGFFKAWRSDLPEPSTRILDYEPVIDPPLADRFRFNTATVVGLCDSTPLEARATVCPAEFKVKTAQLGAHVRGDVAGYFRLAERADVPEAGDADTLDGLDSTDFAAAVHTHDGGDITSGTVGEPYIDPLIARDDEIVPTVLANDGSGSGIDADLLDGRDSLDLMLQVGNCLTVSPSCPAVPADALAARCWQTIQAAIDAADPVCASNCLPAAAGPTNRYVVKVGPGVYTERVIMIPDVDIEGSGQKATTITDDGSVSPGTVLGADDAELRHLTVASTGPAAGASIAFHTIGKSPALRHVTLRASGGANNLALVNATGSVVSLVHVTASAAAETVFDIAVENQTASIVIRDSVLEGDDSAVFNNTGATSSLVNTQLLGPANETGGGNTITCLGAYDGTFTELDTNCQP